MGGMFVEQVKNGKRTLVRGKKRDKEGVRTFDRGWKQAVSKWQEDELVKRLRRKRSVNGCVKELSDVEDPAVLERLKKEGGHIEQAVTTKLAVSEKLKKNSALRVGKRNLK
jgi:hypothetical protein